MKDVKPIVHYQYNCNKISQKAHKRLFFVNVQQKLVCADNVRAWCSGYDVHFFLKWLAAVKHHIMGAAAVTQKCETLFFPYKNN